jgi:dienelactone hydrolase
VVTLAVAPTSRVDEPFPIVVRDAGPGERVTLRASTRDGARVWWAAEAVFTADGEGVVDTGRDAPDTGYRGVDPIGLLWRMTPADPGRTRFFTKARATPLRVTVTATTAGGTASAEVIRQFGGDGVAARPAGDELVGTLFHPDGKHRGVLVLASSDGGQRDHAAALLAAQGYAVLALTYFGAEDLPPSLAGVDLGYLRAAVDWLLDQPEVDTDRPVAVVGLGRGAELALQAAVVDDRLRVVVAASPSALRQAGLPGGGPAWERDGVALPFVRQRTGPRAAFAFAARWLLGRPWRQRPAFTRALRDREAVSAAAIEVERIAGPVLLISGGDDRMWPSRAYARMVGERLGDHGHEVASLVYPDAGHFLAFPYGIPSLPPMVSTSPARRLTIEFGGTPEANARAAAGSWAEIVAFLGRHN